MHMCMTKGVHTYGTNQQQPKRKKDVHSDNTHALHTKRLIIIHVSTL